MVKTLILGSCVSVQGRFVRRLADGRIVVAVGDRQFTGYPPSKRVETPKERAAT